MEVSLREGSTEAPGLSLLISDVLLFELERKGDDSEAERGAQDPTERGVASSPPIRWGSRLHLMCGAAARDRGAKIVIRPFDG